MADEYYLFTTVGVDADRIVAEVRSLDPGGGVEVFDEPDTEGFGPYTTAIACYGTADPEALARHLESNLAIEVLTFREIECKVAGVPFFKTG